MDNQSYFSAAVEVRRPGVHVSVSEFSVTLMEIFWRKQHFCLDKERTMNVYFVKDRSLHISAFSHGYSQTLHAFK